MNRKTSESWHELIQRHLDGITNKEEVKKLSTKLENCSETRLLYLKLQNIHAVLFNSDLDEPLNKRTDQNVLELISNLEQSQRTLTKRRFLITLSSIAAAVLLMLGVGYLWIIQSDGIAKITSIQGAVRWTGDGGRVIETLETGQDLTGGTIETRSVNSVVELRFRDGSTVSTSGGAVLTIADDGQKKIYLRSGVLSADVEKQPSECPMIVVTPTARLEILGTRFDVVANPERSKVSVRQGLVRAVRLSDGKSVKVAGGHSAIAATDARYEFLSRRSDQAVHVWQANLEQDRKPGEGEFLSAMRGLRLEIRDALQRGDVTREQIPTVYGARIAE
ncbi:MAG: FecR family protein, partial [Pirellulaceae bacterium]|nr:FecR family protein [Pirellulaceae bacterium]